MAMSPDDLTWLQKLRGKVDGATAPFGGAGNLGLALLANSGYSTTPRSFGQVLGASALQGQQMAAQKQQTQQEQAMNDIRKRYMEAQIGALQRPGNEDLEIIAGPDGKPMFARRSDAVGKSPYRADGKTGAYQPGDYTTESWAAFTKSGNPADLIRYSTPRQEYSPSYQNVTRTMPDGSTQQGTFNTRTGEYEWRGVVIPPGQKARVDAAGKAEGEAAGGQAAKAPAAASMDYVLGEFDKQIESTSQGGIGGLYGKAGAVFDYEDAQRFDNLREQLSTELRTVYRIPGEGTLSDAEQKQYGIQLPNRNNTEKTNRQILRDLKERTRLRLETPVSRSDSREVASINASPKQASKRVKVDAQGNVVP